MCFLKVFDLSGSSKCVLESGRSVCRDNNNNENDNFQ